MVDTSACETCPEGTMPLCPKSGSVIADGRRAAALRFGDPRVMALVGALCIGLHAVTGITNHGIPH